MIEVARREEQAPVIEVRDLAKTFRVGLLGRQVEAVRDISLALHRGRVLGYLGPNGAGKTTSIKCMLGLIQPSRGEIRFFGRSHRDPLARARIGYLPEHPYFYDYLKPTEVLDYAARLYGVPAAIRKRRIGELLERLGLSHAMDRTLRGFSKGMLQRVGIAQSLVSDPDLLIYDEPLSGLDPIGRKELRDLLAELRRAGKTLFITSHVLGDIETLCDEVVILRQGQAVAAGRLDDLLRRDLLESAATLRVSDAGSADALLARFGDGVTVQQRGEGLLVLRLPSERLLELTQAAASLNAELVELHPVRDTLEELFVRKALALETGGPATAGVRPEAT